jgi:imidazolonepropionase-like amidohydrolase
VSGVASKYLRSRDFEPVEKLMKAAMKVVIGTRYAGGKHQENGEWR